MSRYIDADALLEDNQDVICKGCPDNDDTCANCWIATVMNFPSADVAEVKHGMWNFAPPEVAGFGVMRIIHECSECGAKTTVMTNYCHCCGANMGGAE